MKYPYIFDRANHLFYYTAASLRQEAQLAHLSFLSLPRPSLQSAARPPAAAAARPSIVDSLDTNEFLAPSFLLSVLPSPEKKYATHVNE